MGQDGAWPPRSSVALLTWAGWSCADEVRLSPAMWKEGWVGSRGHLCGVGG